MEFDDLYQEIILDHYKNPRNAGEINNKCIAVEHENPLCGDHLRLMVVVDNDDIIEDLKFTGNGCAISLASASMMTEEIIGKSVDDARKSINLFIQIMQGKIGADKLEEFGDLTALNGVIKFPVRVKCATLAWHALENALEKRKKEFN